MIFEETSQHLFLLPTLCEEKGAVTITYCDVGAGQVLCQKPAVLLLATLVAIVPFLLMKSRRSLQYVCKSSLSCRASSFCRYQWHTTPSIIRQVCNCNTFFLG